MAQASFMNAEVPMISPVNGSRALLGCRWILFGKRSDFPGRRDLSSTAVKSRDRVWEGMRR
jgi:hypothetical protein